jgi:two-component system nitrate/nitrite response regulator NarL
MGMSVSLINPSPISREGLKSIIVEAGIEVIAACSRIEDLADPPVVAGHLVIVDVPTATEQIRCLEILSTRDAKVHVLVLVEAFDLAGMLTCFAFGAQGYAVKDVPCETLIALLRLAALGHKVMPSDLAELLKREDCRLKVPDDVSELGLSEAKLSVRERDVLCCLMAGYSNKRIARMLVVSEATVKVHVKAILRKLNVINRTQAALWATSRGLEAHEQRAPPLACAELRPS